MKLNQLVYFLEIAKTNSYSAASANLYVSQSCISYAIKELETELSVPLFVRSGGKKAVLTEYGRTFLPYVENAISCLENGKNTLLYMHAMPSKETIKIIYSHFSAFFLVQSVFSNNMFHDPKIDLKFISNPRGGSETTESLFNDVVDFAFSCIKPGNNLEGIKVASQELVILCPSDHPLASQKKVKISQITEYPFLWYKDSKLFPETIQQMYEYENCKPNISDTLMINANWFDHISNVSLGNGITIVPNSVAQSAVRDVLNNLSIVKIDSPYRTRPVYMLWKKGKVLSEAAEKVKAHCVQYCSENQIVDYCPDMDSIEL